MATSQNFRVGKVTAYLRGSAWYLRYHENGKRHQVRASDDKKAARQLASKVNAQLETGASNRMETHCVNTYKYDRVYGLIRNTVSTLCASDPA